VHAFNEAEVHNTAHETVSVTENLCQFVARQPFYSPFFWDHPGEPTPEENFWTL